MKKILSIIFLLLFFETIALSADIPDGVTPVTADPESTVTVTASTSRDSYTSKDYANRDGVYYEKATE